MKKICKGVIEGNIIRLEEKIGLPNGAYSIVILKTINNKKQKDIQKDIKNRQLKLLDRGFYLGKKLYSKREDLYDR